MMQQEVKEIGNFYSRYSVTNIDDETQVILSRDSAYLVKMIKLQQENADLDDVVETLEQHLTLNDQYLLTLMDYDIQTTQDTISIRSIYQYGQLTLKHEIEHRRQQLIYFQPQELWMIVYSVTRALEYLEHINIGYGVLGCDKIFLGEKIKLLDPSAIAEDPLIIAHNRLYSPEVLMQREDIDILKSDVFIFGLCLLQTALLVDFTPQMGQRFDETRIRIYLDSVDKLYEPEFSSMIRQMLQYSPNDRPTFSQIREYLENTLQISAVNQDNFYAPLNADSEDESNSLIPSDDTAEFENIDIQEEESSPNQTASLSQFERAKMRFLNQSRISDAQQSLSRISQHSKASSSLLNNSKTVKLEKKKVSKCIKQKLVKKMNSNDLEIIQVVQYGKGRKDEYAKDRKDQIFTNPKLMADIQNELKYIAMQRLQGRSKQNLSNNY